MVAARRYLWLRNWSADISSQSHLSKFPFPGKLLFGEDLDKLVKDLGDSKGDSSQWINRNCSSPWLRCGGNLQIFDASVQYTLLHTRGESSLLEDSPFRAFEELVGCFIPPPQPLRSPSEMREARAEVVPAGVVVGILSFLGSNYFQTVRAGDRQRELHVGVGTASRGCVCTLPLQGYSESRSRVGDTPPSSRSVRVVMVDTPFISSFPKRKVLLDLFWFSSM